jgi:hypothetical protein
MSELPTDAITRCINRAKDFTFAEDAAEAFSQLQALLDENYRKEAQIVELERRITDIHRHYAKRLGD